MRIKVENYLGQQLELKNVISVDGLAPAGATINTSTAGLSDGTFFNSSYTNQRNIVLTIVPDGDAESARLTLWKYFKPKHKTRLYFKTRTRDVYIDGYTEAVEGSPYSMKAAYSISIICPMPFFTDVNPSVYVQDYVTNAFAFPVNIPEEGLVLGSIQANDVDAVNFGEEKTGLIVKIKANGEIVNPSIVNVTSREVFKLNIDLHDGDLVTIDSRRGSKSITLERDGFTYNILNDMSKDSTWLTVSQGQNMFRFSADYGENNITAEYIISTIYEGI